MKIGIQRDNHTIPFSTPVKDFMVSGGRKADLAHVCRVDPVFSQ
jgi:hypothetical protein